MRKALLVSVSMMLVVTSAPMTLAGQFVTPTMHGSGSEGSPNLSVGGLSHTKPILCRLPKVAVRVCAEHGPNGGPPVTPCKVFIYECR